MAIQWYLGYSRAAQAPWPSVILDIARDCEGQNLACGITGFLLFSDTVFLQLIEGPPEATSALWQKVGADRRHTPIWSATGTAENARLTGLPMGYFDADREAHAFQKTALWRGRRNWKAEQADDLIALIEKLARAKYPQAMSGKPPG